MLHYGSLRQYWGPPYLRASEICESLLPKPHLACDDSYYVYLHDEQCAEEQESREHLAPAIITRSRAGISASPHELRLWDSQTVGRTVPQSGLDRPISSFF